MLFSCVDALRGWYGVVTALFLLATTAPASDAADGQSPPPSRPEIRQLIVDLGHQRFKEREAAHRELLRAAERGLETVLDETLPVYAKTDDPEVRVRLGEVLRSIFETRVLNRPRGFLGTSIGVGQTVDQKGVPARVILVRQPIDNSPAAAAGIQAGDMIVAIDAFDMGQDRLLEAFLEYIQRRGPGTMVKLTLKRGDQTQVMEVKLGTMPAEIRALTVGAGIPVDEQFQAWLRERQVERQKKPEPAN